MGQLCLTSTNNTVGFIVNDEVLMLINSLLQFTPSRLHRHLPVSKMFVHMGQN